MLLLLFSLPFCQTIFSTHAFKAGILAEIQSLFSINEVFQLWEIEFVQAV